MKRFIIRKMNQNDSLDYLTYFKEYTLSKEKNPDLCDEKVKAAYLCTRAKNIIWACFDLETSNMDVNDPNIRNGTIIEVGAVSGEHEFSRLCNPGHPITNSHIHNIKDSDVQNENSTHTVLLDFFAWVQSLKTDPSDIVVLIAHNGANFDKKVLVKHINKYSINENLEGIIIADSLYPIKSSLESKQAKLEVVYKELFGNDYVEKHRALDDSKDLKRILEHLCVTKKTNLFDMLKYYLYILQ